MNYSHGNTPIYVNLNKYLIFCINEYFSLNELIEIRKIKSKIKSHMMHLECYKLFRCYIQIINDFPMNPINLINLILSNELESIIDAYSNDFCYKERYNLFQNLLNFYIKDLTTLKLESELKECDIERLVALLEFNLCNIKKIRLKIKISQELLCKLTSRINYFTSLNNFTIVNNSDLALNILTNIKKNKIKILKLLYNFLLDKNINILTNFIQNNNFLTSIDLSNNFFNLESLKILCNCINSTHITKLNLSGNNIGDMGIKFFQTLLSYNKTIKKINLSSNEIGEEGAKIIGESLKTNKYISHLNLKYNHLGDEGVKIIIETAKLNTNLKYLNLNQNKIQSRKKISETLTNKMKIVIKF